MSGIHLVAIAVGVALLLYLLYALLQPERLQ